MEVTGDMEDLEEGDLGDLEEEVSGVVMVMEVSEGGDFHFLLGVRSLEGFLG